MRLKRLELFGFKSFADRTVIPFDHPLVGVVGPNGCGKSNVVDAVRWVLGEQRPSSLRGGEMADVIFKGSASRDSLSVAEVTMVLEGASDELGGALPGEEVSITRRLFRTGEGEYLIDGQRVRLKDVREMLFGTGLGSRGYAVLEQGRIDAVLAANPRERRGLFEEAAGISRYRQRRKETEARLKRVHDDLVRLDDLLGELKTRSRSLKIQAGRAQRFVEARDAWRVEGLKLARHQVSGLLEELSRCRTDLQEREGCLDSERSLREDAAKDAATHDEEQAVLDAELRRLNEEASRVAGDLRALDERTSLLGERVLAGKKSSEDEAARAVDLGGRLDTREEELASLRGEMEILEESNYTAGERAADLRKEARSAVAAHREAREGARVQGEAVLALIHERTVLENRVHSLGESLSSADDRIGRGSSRRDEQAAQLAAAREAVGAAEHVLQAAEARVGDLERERTTLDASGKLAMGKIEALEVERERQAVEHARLESRRDSLEDWERERQGLDTGARALLEGVGQEDGPELAKGIRGILADHLRTSSRTAKALDAVLGHWAQALVLATPEDALVALDWLQRGEGGQVLLALPGTGAGPLGTLPPGLLSTEGVLGSLADEVQAGEGFDSLSQSLLGGVILVQEVALALKLRSSFPQFTFVTLAGELAGEWGMVGGERESAQGPISRRSEATDLGIDVERQAASLRALEAELEGLRTASRSDEDRLNEVMDAREDARGERAHARAGIEGARTREAELIESQEIDRLEWERVQAEREGIARDRAKALEGLEEARSRFEEQNERLGEFEESTRHLEEVRDKKRAEEGTAQVESARFSEQNDALGRRLADMGVSIGELRSERERAEHLAREHASNAVRDGEERGALSVQKDGLLRSRGDLEGSLEGIRTRHAAGKTAAELLRQKADLAARGLESLMEDAAGIRLDVQRAELRQDELQRRAEEDFGLRPFELLDGFVLDEDLAGTEALESLNTQVTELKNRMDTLGPVNLDAVEELEAVTERLTFLESQSADLGDARRSMEGTLLQIDQECERLFVATFDQIRDQFRTTFRQLFGGGRADLELEEGVSALEAGIEITVRPPGRETLPIRLLSGGQKSLTAIALLFALFKSRPSPFCVLDEVDAALDESNTARFLGLLREFLEETQFVIVTHNKGSMAACDILHGVTMQTHGVSSVVHVSMADVDEFVPEAHDPKAAEADSPGEGGGGRGRTRCGDPACGQGGFRRQRKRSGMRQAESLATH